MPRKSVPSRKEPLNHLRQFSIVKLSTLQNSFSLEVTKTKFSEIAIDAIKISLSDDLLVDNASKINADIINKNYNLQSGIEKMRRLYS